MIPRTTNRFAILGTLACVCTLCGCGWTPRDQLARDRALTFAPSRGDGTIYAESPVLSQRGIEVSRAGLTISDTIP